ncbi:AfsR/SARP family transcriptional regulator [Labedaea rhizosphaerae]|uniref:Transcriptional regulator n=1 Tax=Labedaea rhizosphaerae TaxID=598644 RepID=A0A4R6RSW0_LABRH|nr:BTAD domain-containing putative transcriptional regulator [Labedaea rhizosphaerae]TDP89941.1 transcriptional regulator [Labedaea rhizosphaerae]
MRADRGWVALRSSPRRRLLELLAMQSGRTVPLDAIVGELWGDGPPEWPREAVQTQIRRLRKTFTDLPVRSDDHGYLLDLPPGAVDALHMVMLVESASGLEDEELVSTLDQALALWSGEPFGGMAFGARHAAAAAHWAEVRSRALRLWASAQLRLGRPKPVISRLRAERVGDFADESLYRLLIDALDQVGREMEAVTEPPSPEVVEPVWTLPEHVDDPTGDRTGDQPGGSSR